MDKCVLCGNAICACDEMMEEEISVEEHPSNLNDLHLPTVGLPKRSTGANSEGMYDWDVICAC